MKKPSFGITLMSILLILSSLIIISGYYFSALIPPLAFNLSMIFTIYPIEAIFVLPFGSAAMVNLTLGIIGILCGVGLLFLNKFIRIFCFILASLKIIFVILMRIVVSKVMMNEPWTTQSIIFVALALLVPLGYIIFLTRPKVKEQFKKPLPTS